MLVLQPERITAGLRRLINAYDGPVGGYPNIGYMPLAPVDPDKPTMTNQLRAKAATSSRRPTTTRPAAGFARQWKEMGARIIGGCCATGPEHVMALAPAELLDVQETSPATG